MRSDGVTSARDQVQTYDWLDNAELPGGARVICGRTQILIGPGRLNADFHLHDLPRGRLTLAQKDKIARVCTDVYHEEYGLARYLIQVMFCEIAEGDRYVAGQPAQSDLVWMRCDLREGRDEAQKAAPPSPDTASRCSELERI